jgi:hypothetical protein
MRAAWRDSIAARERLRVTADAYSELDAERVLVLNRSSGRGWASRLSVERTDTDEATGSHRRGVSRRTEMER